jgi:glycosyltransferase involved in cell wall biosynthesis
MPLVEQIEEASRLRPAGRQSVSIILPVVNETTSLERTVEIILRDAGERICEIIIVICSRTTADSRATIDLLVQQHPGLIVVHTQHLPFLGGALRESIDLARGSHIALMASDLETNPDELAQMLVASDRHPEAIIQASRWRKGGSFTGYSPLKLVLNRIFQMFFSVLYGVSLTDMTFGYRVYPTRVIQSIAWEELRHPFLLECLVKPIRLGTPVIEVTSVWTARIEGESQNTFFRNFVYFRTGLKSRFANRKSILKSGIAV